MHYLLGVYGCRLLGRECYLSIIYSCTGLHFARMHTARFYTWCAYLDRQTLTVQRSYADNYHGNRSFCAQRKSRTYQMQAKIQVYSRSTTPGEDTSSMRITRRRRHAASRTFPHMWNWGRRTATRTVGYHRRKADCMQKVLAESHYWHNGTERW